jgi:Carboxypeptidase regulatory-like domain/CarboxypepD_reg-like domain
MRISRIGGLALTLAALASMSLRAQDLLLTGHVTFDGDRPLLHAQVFLEGTGIGGLTDDDGKYAFVLSAARLHGQTAKLTARIIGFKPSSVDVVLSGTTIEHDFVLVPQLQNGPRDYVSSSPSTLTTTRFSGRVTDDHGAPLASAAVSVAGQGFGAITTDDGKYSFSAPNDHLSSSPRVVARHSGYRTRDAVDTIAGRPIVQDFVLSEKPARPMAVVRDSEGKPVSPQLSMASAAVARIAGLPSLQEGPHRKGEREIRLWNAVAIAYPSTLYRVVNSSGRITGERIQYVVWRSEPDRKYFRKVSPEMANDMCTTFTLDSLFTCHARISKSVDWQEIWRRLELAGVWDIPDQSQSDEAFHPVLDGTFMTVELWDGEHYRSWSYGNPSELSDAAAVREIMSLIR